MLSASHGVPLPHVMTDLIDLPDGTKQKVIASSVAVEIENSEGKVATVFRSVKGEISNRLIRVAVGAVLSENDNAAQRLDYYVREGGAATAERGFHTWFASFLGWKLPKVTRVDGTECPLYVECIFPLMIIEQKRGWTAIQARMPFHYRIREVAKRSVEFLLQLEVNDLAHLRQQLREQAHAIREEWSIVTERISTQLTSVNAVPQGIDRHQPRAIASDESIPVLVARGGKWVPLAEAIKQARAELRELEKAEIPRVEKIAQEAETALAKAREELAMVDFETNEVFRAVQQDEQQLLSLDERLVSLEEDDRRNNDLLKLQRLGSVEKVAAAKGQCPTCHQSVTDSLIPLNKQTPMTAEENLKFIRAQIDTFAIIKKSSSGALTAKHRRLTSLQQRATELRASIRALQKTLTSDARAPSVEAIERRLRLRESVTLLERANERLSHELPQMRELGQRWINLQSKIAKLPKGDLSAGDRAKLTRLTELFVSNVTQFELKSVDPQSLKISDENYRPEHDGFDLEFDISASDMIRTIWAYLHSLLELSREVKTNHLGFLVLDEPKQQETARSSFRQLFLRASNAIDQKQQVIIATSEEMSTLVPLLDGVRHQFVSFSERIVKPIADISVGPATAETLSEDNDYSEDPPMPWDAESRAAVMRAIESFEWDTALRVIRFRTYHGNTSEASSYDDLYTGLCAVARDAWNSLVPIDDGEAVFALDEDALVDELLSTRAEEIERFFNQ